MTGGILYALFEDLVFNISKSLYWYIINIYIINILKKYGQTSITISCSCRCHYFFLRIAGANIWWFSGDDTLKSDADVL